MVDYSKKYVRMNTVYKNVWQKLFFFLSDEEATDRRMIA